MTVPARPPCCVRSRRICFADASHPKNTGVLLRDTERLRAGGNRHIDWWEEMTANTYLGRAWDQAQLGLRMGDELRVATYRR
jgi:hypothetical protein